MTCIKSEDKDAAARLVDFCLSYLDLSFLPQTRLLDSHQSNVLRPGESPIDIPFAVDIVVLIDYLAERYRPSEPRVPAAVASETKRPHL